MNIEVNEKSRLTFYDVILIWVGIVSTLIIITLCLGRFSPFFVLVGGVILTIIILVFGKIYPVKEVRLNLVVLLLLFLALLFRYSTATHYMGSQDQGLYVNMSASMTKSGKVDFTDRLKASLPDDLQAKTASFKLIKRLNQPVDMA